MSCKIELNNYKRPYFPGNFITGRVICNFQAFEDIKEIYIKLNGLERVYWVRNRVRYSARRKFLRDKVDLAAGGSLGSGQHDFPFSFRLPAQLPTSFTGKYGWVTYTLKAVVVRSMKMNYKHNVKIAVIAPLDQNKLEDRSLLQPGAYEGEKTLCCLCCSKGLIEMKVFLEKKTFVPGETIKIRVDISNKSHAKITSVKAKYWVHVTSTVTSILRYNTILQRFVIAKTKSEHEIGSHQVQSYELFLKLPMMDAVPNFFDSSILSTQAGIQIIAVLPKFHLDMNLAIATLLADIPIGGVEDYFARKEQAGVYEPPKKGKKTTNTDKSSMLRIMGV